MKAKQLDELLTQFLFNHPKGTVTDFANYIRTILEIEEL